MSFRAILPPALALFALLSAGTSVGAAQPATSAVAAVRELYLAASYRDALALLDDTQQATLTPAERTASLEYRALCLLALNRQTEARGAFETLVRETPLYQPAGDEMSPRVRQVFADVRRQVLPEVAAARYAAGKTAYDAHQYADAVRAFEGVAEVIDAAWVVGAPSEARLGDIMTLAKDFRELALAALARSVEAVGPLVARPARGGGRKAATAVPAAPVATLVSPPVTIRQDLPQWPSRLGAAPTRVGVFEIVIGLSGVVEQAQVKQSIHPLYDALLIDATRNWRYQPAMRDGAATPYLKTLRVELGPRRSPR
jgi:tetratricopeptide (TPR) repeat protein